jgi:hypothetical protein
MSEIVVLTNFGSKETVLFDPETPLEQVINSLMFDYDCEGQVLIDENG